MVVHMAKQMQTSQNPTVSGTGFSSWWLVLLLGILAVIVGLLFLVFPNQSIQAYLIFLGVYWIFGGLISLIALAKNKSDPQWELFFAVISIIAGVAILTYPYYSFVIAATLYVTIIGLWAFLMGAAKLFRAYIAKDAGSGVLGIINLVFGVLIIANPLVTAGILAMIFGVFSLVAGLAAIGLAYRMKQAQETA